MINVDADVFEPLFAISGITEPTDRRRLTIAVKKAGANVIRREAYKRAPVWKPRETHHQPFRKVPSGRYYGGGLKKTLKTPRTGLAVTGKGNVFIVGGGARYYVPYAHLVEFGHEGPKAAPPHPFLEPAAEHVAEQARTRAIEEFARGVTKRLERGRKSRARFR